MFNQCSCTDLLPTFSSEEAAPKYIVALEDAQRPERGRDKGPEWGTDVVLPMKDKYGRQYSCLLPGTTQPGEKEAQEDSGPQVRLRCTARSGLM